MAGNRSARRQGYRMTPPSLLVGMLFDGEGNRMTPSHAAKKDTRYRYYVSRSLMTQDRTETSAELRIPAAEIEHLVSSRVHRWLLDPGSIYKSTSARFTDASMQRRLVARAADLGKCWPQLPVARQRAVLAALVERIEVSLDQIDIRLRPPRLGALLDVTATRLCHVYILATREGCVPRRIRAGFPTSVWLRFSPWLFNVTRPRDRRIA
jgi:site-specific DNA recombinase